jgi:hypothetical protein
VEQNPWLRGFAMDDIIPALGSRSLMKACVNRSFGLLCLAVLLAYPPALRLLSLAV